jgi:hypothetical protein
MVVIVLCKCCIIDAGLRTGNIFLIALDHFDGSPAAGAKSCLALGTAFLGVFDGQNRSSMIFVIRQSRIAARQLANR